MRNMLAVYVRVAVILGVVPCASAGIITTGVTPLGGDAYSISIFAPGLNVTALNIASLSWAPEIGGSASGFLAVGAVSSGFDGSANNGSLGPTGDIGGINGQVLDPATVSVTGALYTFTWTGTSSTNSIGIGLAGTGGPTGPEPYIEYYDGSGPTGVVRVNITGILPVVVPEPSTLSLLGLGCLMLIGKRKIN